MVGWGRCIGVMDRRTGITDDAQILSSLLHLYRGKDDLVFITNEPKPLQDRFKEREYIM